MTRVRSDRWALSTQFRAGTGTVEHATTLPDPRDDRECAGASPTQRDTPPHRVAARANTLRALARTE